MALGTLRDDAESEGGDEPIFAEINITPLTDVFLVLLIIFMLVAATLLQQEKKAREQVEEQVATEKRSGLKINLPSGAAQEIDPTASSIVVTILSSGEVIVNDKKVDEKDLDAVFRSAFARNKETQVVLKADSGVQHGRVVNVMERAKQVGLTKLAIATASAGGG